MSSVTSNRRYDLDWLRVAAILVVFLYHSTRFFNLGDWHVKNADTYLWVEIWNVFATRWMMPLFFVISGASLFYAVGKSVDWRRFYTDKFLRLMIPVMFGSVTFSVLQVYLERVTHGQFSGSFFEFLPESFNGVYLGIGMPGNFAFHGMHLWYLLFLFVYSLICYRLFVWLKAGGRQVLERISAFMVLPGMVYLGFSLPLVALKALLPQAALEVGNGGWGFLYYLWFLIAGFVIFSSDRLQKHIVRQRRVSLLLGVVVSSAHLYQLFSPSRLVLPAAVADWTLALCNFFSSWCWLLAILGFGMRHLAFDRPWLRSANESVMPFYILHQTVLLGVGYFVIARDIHDGLKWLTVFTGSFLMIATVCLPLVRHFERLVVHEAAAGAPLAAVLVRGLVLAAHVQRGDAAQQHAGGGTLAGVFRERKALIALPPLFVGLIFFAGVNMSHTRSPMPLTFDPEEDILLSAASITRRSLTGIRVVEDEEASGGRAIEFYSGESVRAQAQPAVFVEMRFSASPGRYIVWLRGKTEIDNGYTDSVWVQVDDQIGTKERSVRMGNWLDVHPAGVYGWAGDTDDPVAVELAGTGDHRIRIQPRQIPHRIDQIWLSRFQRRIPDTLAPIVR